MCGKWSEAVIRESGEFSQFFDSEFSIELNKQREKLSIHFKRARQLVQAGNDKLQPLTTLLTRHLQSLSRSSQTDPWIHEVSIRHHSALYLQAKEAHLQDLQVLFNETRMNDAELYLQLANLKARFFSRLRQCQRVIAAETEQLIGEDGEPSDLHRGSFLATPQTNYQTPYESEQWAAVLEQYSLAYEWTLQVPPLDGFLCTLYNILKSSSDSDVQLSISNRDHLPRLIADDGLRAGFMIRSSKGLISRSWNPCYAILQKHTKFLHVYKPSFSSLSGAGHVHVPQPGNQYDKHTLSELNALAEQFLYSQHQPGSIDGLLLNPYTSVHLGPDSSVSSDPSSCTLSLKVGGDKLDLRAFCEEDMVDWVITFKECIRGRVERRAVAQESKTNEPEELAYNQEPTYQHQQYQEESPPSAYETVFSDQEPQMYVDIEDPWSK